MTYGPAANNEVIITLPESRTSESALDAGRAAIVSTLTNNYSVTASRTRPRQARPRQRRTRRLADWLAQKDPEHLGSSDAATQRYTQQANAILDYRDTRTADSSTLSTIFPA